MAGILAFLETKDGSLRKVSFEVLSLLQKLCNTFSVPSFALLVGKNLDGLAPQVRGHSEKAILIELEEEFIQRPDILAKIMSLLNQRYSFSLIIGPHTLLGRFTLSFLSVLLSWQLVPDVVSVEIEGEDLIVKKPVFGGKLISSMKIKAENAVITVRPNSFPLSEPSYKTEFINEDVPLEEEKRIKLLTTKAREEKKVDLQETDFIICGGRGMKSPENFKILEEIADIMGGRVGASRAVVDAKWRDYEDQIGKSGKTVSPLLYIGCGVSGAVHHTMGIDTSKFIVAINSDPKAPIFEIADYGIVDDLFTVLPILKEELKKAKEKA